MGPVRIFLRWDIDKKKEVKEKRGYFLGGGGVGWGELVTSWPHSMVRLKGQGLACFFIFYSDTKFILEFWLLKIYVFYVKLIKGESLN